MQIVITRPEPDATKLAKHLAAQNIDALIAPLIEIRFRDNIPIPDKPYQAILATSANGIRALGGHDDFERLSKLPLYAVGDSSAREAEKLGFTQVHSAAGNLGALSDLVEGELQPKKGPLLYVTGQRIAGDLAKWLEQFDFEVDRIVLYDAVAVQSFDDNVSSAIKAKSVDGVILMSPRTAKTWAALAAQTTQEAAFAALDYYCLSDAVALALKSSLTIDDMHVIIAREPTQADLIDAVMTRKNA